MDRPITKQTEQHPEESEHSSLSGIVTFRIKPSQVGLDGYFLVGDVYFNEGQIYASEDAYISFFLKKAKISASCVDCTFDTESISFSISDIDNRKFTLKVVDSKESAVSKVAEAEGEASFPAKSEIPVSLSGKFGGKIKSENTHVRKEEIAPSDNIMIENFTVLDLSRAPSNISWNISASKNNNTVNHGIPNGVIYGSRLNTPGGQLGYVIDKNVGGKVQFGIEVNICDIHWVIPSDNGFYSRLIQKIPGFIGKKIREITDPTSVEAMVARTFLAKKILRENCLAVISRNEGDKNEKIND
ncbi:hypothetical protein [Niveispirillum cyanobacteriorum]|uniref:hypothetical protein n=1 Tax=Niveispirillum cyanobacteriorum TaxID=1612173 RepID=UPI001319E453|nr:hypothetical protein [Niveispirillum cyanobacteriorum]